MAQRNKRTTPAPSVAAAFAERSEHIYIESDDLNANPATAARTIRGTISLSNRLRDLGVNLVFYAEGVLKVTERRNRTTGTPYFLDLRYLDPLPAIERVVAKRWFLSALGCAATAALAGFLLRFDALEVFAMATLIGCGLAAAGALYFGVYSSYERTEFCTLHGRTTVLRLTANLGSLRRFRRLVPLLSAAIEEAAERIGTDTAAFLRAEMREHYRLRGERVLDSETCAAGTGRILAQFDLQL